MGLHYYIIDTETTGLKAGYHEITEISIIRCTDRHQLTKKIRASYPDRANAISLEKTNRTMADLLVGDDKMSVIQACNTFFAQDGVSSEDRCIVAHNSAFDKRFCHATWESAGLVFPANNWMDTIKFAKEWAKRVGNEPANYQLATVLKFANIKPMPGAHDAGSDARNTYLFWKKGMDMAQNLGINHLQAIKREPHLTNV